MSRTSEPVRIQLPIRPLPTPRQRCGRARSYPDPKYVAWLREAAAFLDASGWPKADPEALLKARRTSFHVAIVARAQQPKKTVLGAPRGDVDNIAKGPLDVLTGRLWHDDTQVKGLTIVKEWAEPGAEPSIDIVVRPFKEGFLERLMRFLWPTSSTKRPAPPAGAGTT